MEKHSFIFGRGAAVGGNASAIGKDEEDGN